MTPDFVLRSVSLTVHKWHCILLRVSTQVGTIFRVSYIYCSN